MTVLGMSIIFVGTALGALTAFIFKKDSPKANTLFLGFAAGIMVAASIWSLLDPSLEQAEQSGIYGDFSWVPAAFGFIIGGLFLTFLDKVLPHIHTSGEEEGLQSNLAKPMKMFVAVTIHNIPEGLAVGVTYSVAAVSAAAFAPSVASSAKPAPEHSSARANSKAISLCIEFPPFSGLRPEPLGMPQNSMAAT